MCMLKQYSVQFLRFKKWHHAIYSFLGLIIFFIAVIKYPNKRNLGGKGTIPVHSSREKDSVVRNVWWQEYEASLFCCISSLETEKEEQGEPG